MPLLLAFIAILAGMPFGSHQAIAQPSAANEAAALLADEEKIDTADSKREKNLVFDESLVEGLSKTPRDFATLLGTGRDKDRTHLYQRNLNFDRELSETLQNLRFQE